jgi:hypothetical protein
MNTVTNAANDWQDEFRLAEAVSAAKAEIAAALGDIVSAKERIRRVLDAMSDVTPTIFEVTDLRFALNYIFARLDKVESELRNVSANAPRG